MGLGERYGIKERFTIKKVKKITRVLPLHLWWKLEWVVDKKKQVVMTKDVKDTEC